MRTKILKNLFIILMPCLGLFFIAAKGAGEINKSPRKAIKKKVTTKEEKKSIFDFSITHVVGLEGGHILPPFGFKDDPYSGPIGGGLFYEAHGLFKLPLYSGVCFSYYLFISNNEDFSGSYMLQPGVYGGYNFVFPINKHLNWGFSPHIGYKHYFSEYSFKEEKKENACPIFFAGNNLNLFIGKNFIVGLKIEYNLLFEKTILHTFKFGGSFAFVLI